MHKHGLTIENSSLITGIFELFAIQICKGGNSDYREKLNTSMTCFP